jgi:hypothetical protein
VSRGPLVLGRTPKRPRSTRANSQQNANREAKRGRRAKQYDTLAPKRTGRRCDIGSEARNNPGTDDVDWPGKGNNGPSSEDYRLLISCDASNSVPDSSF